MTTPTSSERAASDRAAPVLPLPLAIEDVTRSWLQAALATRAPGVRLNGFAIVEAIRGTCTKLRLRLDLDAAGIAAGIPEWVILKGGFEPHSRAMHYMLAHEVHAYADVAPWSPLRMPRCFFAAYDAVGGQGIVIMEDLRARGATFLHAQQPQAPDAVAVRLGALARHHAMTWGSPDIEPDGRLGWADDYVGGFEVYGREVLTTDVWQGYVASARGAAASVRFHSLEWMRGVLAKLKRHAGTRPRVLLHGDTHLGNLYIDVDGAPGFFDSLPHAGPAMIEIAYHVTCALDLADRRTHERDLVAHYRGELIAAGVDAPPLDALMHDFGCYLATGYLIFLVNAAAFQPEPINTAYTARFSAAMLDHDTRDLIERLP